jgi:hypothetical protein
VRGVAVRQSFAQARFARTFPAMYRLLFIFACALVGQAALQIDGVSPPLSGATVPEGQTQTFDIDASSDSSILFRWFVDDVEQVAESASSFDLTPGFDSIIHVDLAPLEKAGTVRCEVSTEQDATQTLTWNITIADTNRPPVVQGNVSITPAPRAGLDDNLTCLVEGAIVDPDPEDSVQLMFLWQSGIKEILSCPIGASEDVLQAENTEAGETWTCSVYGIDQLQLRSSTPTVATVDINTPPSVTELHVLNDHGVQTLSFFPGDSMEAVASGVDVNDDALTFAYTWLRDGDDSGVNDATLFLDENSFAYQQEVTLLVNAFDGFDFGPPAQLSTTLGWRFRFDWVGQSCHDLAIGVHADASDGADALDVLSEPGDGASLLPGRPGDFGTAHNVDIRAVGDEFRWALSLAGGQPLSWNKQAGYSGATLVMYPIDRQGYVLGDVIYLGSGGVISAQADPRHYIIRLSERQTRVVTWPAGWSMRASPIRLAQPALTDVFDSHDPAYLPHLLAWDGAVLSPPEELTNQQGFWVYLPREVKMALRGSEPFLNVLTLQAGWNLVSVFGYVAAPSFPERGSPFWYYDLAEQRYRAAAELAPGQGYWIYSKSPVTLDLTL